MNIRFLADYQVKAEGGRLYKAGQVYSVSPDTASHFISRGRAVMVVEEEKIETESFPTADSSSGSEVNEDVAASASTVVRKQLKRQRTSNPSDIHKDVRRLSVEE